MRLPLQFLTVAIGTLMSCSVFAGDSTATTNYPSKPVHLIVPYPAGGGADHWGQLVAAKLSEQLGQPVQVENIPGKGGNNGTSAAAQATPDGYTLLLGSVGPLAVHPFTYSALAYNAEKDFVPIALLESSPIILIEHPAVPAASATELIGLARKQPDSLSYASNGDGSPEEVAGEIFKKRLQLAIRHIPYDGAGPARKSVLAGQASLMFDPCKGALPLIRGGKEKPLAVAAATRLSELPDVPTFEEVGVPKYELRIWTGVLAPKGTPKEIVARLNEAIQGILRTPEIRKEITEEGGEAGATTPAVFTAYIQAERKHWSALVAESGISKVQ